MEGRAVALRVDGDGPETHLAAGPDDANRDFAAIGDEHLRQGVNHWNAIVQPLPE
jgi:hypothetical protein